MHIRLKPHALVILILVPTFGFAQQFAFDIGTAHWVGSFPGPGTYNNSISGIQVTGTADRIIDPNVDPTAVFSGNDSPAVARNFSYNFPSGSNVSIDFFQLTNNSSNLPESIGNFSVAPSQANVGTGHSLIGTDLRLEGSASATINTVSTLIWNNIDSLSFDIASNGNVAFVGHRNLVVSGIQPAAQSVPSLSIWSIAILLLTLGFVLIRHQKAVSQESL